jgi:hypothetical protein
MWRNHSTFERMASGTFGYIVGIIVGWWARKIIKSGAE